MSHLLHSHPLCHADDLGSPIPDSPHAVSVCLPTWADVIGYEEKDPRVIYRMRTGYPRFFLHPLIKEVRAALAPGPGCDALPFHDRAAALECAALTRGEAVERAGLWATFFRTEALPIARAYWQHAGRILSSRAAEDWLTARKLAAPDAGVEEILKARLAGWSGVAQDNISLHPSGMAAIFTAFQLVTSRRPGRRTVMFGFPYTDTLKILEKFGSGTVFLPHGNTGDLDKLRGILEHEEIAAIFCEFPGNPLLNTPDLPAIRSMAAARGVPLVVDDTIGTSFNVDVLAHADLVATSLTKAVSGEGDVMGGALTMNPHGLLGETSPRFAPGGIYARDLQVLEHNSRNFAERMAVANANALELARFLAGHQSVQRVWYPGLDPSPVFEKLAKPGGGFGAVISFLPRDAGHNTPRIFERLNVSRGISLGTSYTLVCPYVQLAHYHELDWAAECGIDPFLLRVAVGTEPWPDLRERFAAALGK